MSKFSGPCGKLDAEIFGRSNAECKQLNDKSVITIAKSLQ